MITTADALTDLLARLAEAPRIAIDTEADSLHCYFEKLCLIQISAPGIDALVDPLADFSLQPLFDLCGRKPLVFHGLDYDVRLLRRNGRFDATDIFDTMIAARLTGTPEFSLAALIQRHFDVQLAKGSQKADWARRPLTPQMAEYAINDTKYLLRLEEILDADLRRLGRREWFRQSVEKAVLSAQTPRERDPDSVWRIAKSGDLRGRGSALVRELWRWRDGEAQQIDRPAFHILRNEELIESARRFDAGEPVEIRHLRGHRKHGFYEAAKRALALPPEEWPQRVRGKGRRQTPDEETRVKELKKKRDAIAVDLGLDPSLIAPKATLDGLVMEPESARERLMPWQRELLEM